MAEFFELSLIYSKQPDVKGWYSTFSLNLQKSIYSGSLKFYNDRELLFNEFKDNNIWEYEFSVSNIDLFSRENVIDKVLELLEAVNEIMMNDKFEYGIGNIETNGSFISSNKDSLNPSKEMILKSTLIFLPLSKLKMMEINLHHFIFKKGKTVCLFNPTSGILYSSQSENYKILRESIIKKI